MERFVGVSWLVVWGIVGLCGRAISVREPDSVSIHNSRSDLVGVAVQIKSI
jgi:hypothetical protein